MTDRKTETCEGWDILKPCDLASIKEEEGSLQLMVNLPLGGWTSQGSCVRVVTALPSHLAHQFKSNNRQTSDKTHKSLLGYRSYGFQPMEPFILWAFALELNPSQAQKCKLRGR